MKAEVSNGELVDKITILELKKNRIKDARKVANVTRELEELTPCLSAMGLDTAHPLYKELLEINGTLWDIEDAIRRKEAAKCFDAEFVELARSVYINNDRRSRAKQMINKTTGSALVEEKEYAQYKA